MTKASFRLKSLTAPLFVVVDGDAGGIGKSTLVILIAMAFDLVDAMLDVFELDEQRKLARFLGKDVQSLHGAKLDLDEDGDRDLIPVFAPLHQAVVAMPQTGRSVVLEVGGALTGIWNSFIREINFEEDLVELGLTMVVFLVLVASEESTRQVLAQIKELRQIVPSANIVIVLNERDGRPTSEDLPPELGKGLEQALKVYPSIKMPRLPQKSRRLYEKLGVLPGTVISWHRNYYTEAIQRTGLKLLRAKQFVGQFAWWAQSVRTELKKVLPFLGGNNAG